MEQRKATVLVVDDSVELLSILEAILSLEGLTVHTESQPDRAAGWAREHVPDLILLDLFGAGGMAPWMRESGIYKSCRRHLARRGVLAANFWIDPDDDVRPYGCEAEHYSGLSPPYGPRNGPLLSVEELLLVHDGRVEDYADDLQGYERWVLSTFRQDRPATAPAAEQSRKAKRQQAAEARAKLRPLQRAVEEIEAAMGEIERELEALQASLADAGLYADDRREELAALLHQEGQLKSRAAELEERWFEQQQALEELQGG